MIIELQIREHHFDPWQPVCWVPEREAASLMQAFREEGYQVSMVSKPDVVTHGE